MLSNILIGCGKCINKNLHECFSSVLRWFLLSRNRQPQITMRKLHKKCHNNTMRKRQKNLKLYKTIRKNVSLRIRIDSITNELIKIRNDRDLLLGNRKNKINSPTTPQNTDDERLKLMVDKIMLENIQKNVLMLIQEQKTQLDQIEEWKMWLRKEQESLENAKSQHATEVLANWN